MANTSEIRLPLETIEVDLIHSRDNSQRKRRKSYLERKSVDEREQLLYEIDDNPPWYLSLLLGFQHYITMSGSTIATPVILGPYLCMASNDPNKANIICTIMFISGIVTILQSTFGTRLPIIQGGSFSFIVVTIAVLSQPEFQCPPGIVQNRVNDDIVNQNQDSSFRNFTEAELEEIWQIRMREIQGAIIVASIFEAFIGLFGIIGKILKYITPLTVAPAIAMIGLSLFKTSADYASGQWGIAFLTMLLIIIFSQYCKNVEIPIPFTSTKQKIDKSGPEESKASQEQQSSQLIKYPVFQVFPVLLSMIIVWILCWILTATGALPEGNPARTDINQRIISDTPWFRVPYPFQWGWPTVSVGAVLGMIAACITSTVESIGDYYACARISGAKAPPIHAINRGIFIEGFGCILAGIFGTGTGTTSLSQNIGAIGISKVGSRRVIQAAGCIMVAFALVGKIGAVFVSIPEPIIGGIFIIVFATVAGVGLSNLHEVDLNSTRNVFIIGFSIFSGLTISEWMLTNQGAISTGVDTLDQIFTILLQTGMFVSFFVGFILDNTVPGTALERGIHHHIFSEELPSPSYDIPFITEYIKRFPILQKIPISPTYNPKKSS